MSRQSPLAAITAYDLLKTFAVLCMVTDHIGHYFLPDDNWTRMVGRLCVPIWFFLIGHANTRQIPFLLTASAIFLVGINVIVGLPLMPLNVLPTLIFVRLTLDKTIACCLKSDLHLWGISIFLLIAAIPSYFISEYGTLGLILAIFGYLVRHRGTHEKISKDYVQNYMVFTSVTFLFLQQISFAFNMLQLAMCSVLSIAIFYYLLSFDGSHRPPIIQTLPKAWKSFLHFCGRHTLEIYVIHLTLFKIAALLLGYEGYSFINLKIFPPDL